MKTLLFEEKIWTTRKVIKGTPENLNSNSSTKLWKFENVVIKKKKAFLNLDAFTYVEKINEQSGHLTIMYVWISVQNFLFILTILRKRSLLEENISLLK